MEITISLPYGLSISEAYVSIFFTCIMSLNSLILGYIIILWPILQREVRFRKRVICPRQ